MKRMFPGFYRPTLKEFTEKFKECVFSFDTSSLLNLYRYTPESRDNLLKILGAVKDRMWLPHQVGYEYHDNRIEVIIGQQGIYEELKKGVDKAINSLDQHRRSASFQATSLIEPIRKALDEVKADLDKKKVDHPDLLNRDPILDALTELFDGKVGNPYDPEELKKKLTVAKQRFEAKLPPGYLDSTGRKKKEGDKKYGDVVLWFQLLDFATTTDKPMILVTGEAGEDWWQKADGRTVGPRPELLQEMHKEATGKWFYLYSTEKFLEYSKDLLQLEVKPEVIKETQDIKTEDEERARSEEVLRDALDAVRQGRAGASLGPQIAGAPLPLPGTPDLSGSIPSPPLSGVYPNVPDFLRLAPKVPDLSGLVPKISDLLRLSPNVPDLSGLTLKISDLLGLMPKVPDLSKISEALEPILEQRRQAERLLSRSSSQIREFEEAARKAQQQYERLTHSLSAVEEAARRAQKEHQRLMQESGPVERAREGEESSPRSKDERDQNPPKGEPEGGGLAK